PEQVRDLARLVTVGKADVRAIADELRQWSV
ncbi:fic family toxin-antitoxin system, toxin component, partial [Streptomyces sp. 24-1644]